MRISRRVLTIGFLIGTLGLLAIPSASSTPQVDLPDYDFQVSGWPAAPDVQVVPPDTPFFLLHGWGNVDETYPRDGYSVHMFLDGVELEPTFVGCVILEPTPGSHCRNYLWDFPEGIDAPGEYELVGMWMAPCGALSADGQFPGPILSDIVIESCLDDRKPMVHPDLVSRKTLLIGDVPEPSLTPVDWTISIDFFDQGVHSIFTIADVRPMTEDAVEELFGMLVWDGETVVDLCGVDIREVGDGYIHIGDGYSTDEGCGDDPAAMQDAFDAFGLPDRACVGLAAHGDRFEYCAPLEVVE